MAMRQRCQVKNEWTPLLLPLHDVDVDNCGLDALTAAAKGLRITNKFDPEIKLDGCRIPVILHDQDAEKG